MKTYCVFETRGGWIAMAAKDGKLTHSTLPKQSRENALDALDAGLDGSFVEDIAAFGDLPGRLIRYFEGEQVDFSDVIIDTGERGQFHAKALKAALKIPYGTLVSYRELAAMAGRERASRAAGSAMAGNTIPIIVPCHRVVASGGRIGGFSSGLEWKRELLKIEGVEI